MPQTLCFFGICMSASAWFLLAIGVTVLVVAGLYSLVKALGRLGSALQGLGSALSNFFIGVAYLLAFSVCFYLIYYLVHQTVPPGDLPWRAW